MSNQPESGNSAQAVAHHPQLFFSYHWAIRIYALSICFVIHQHPTPPLRVGETIGEVLVLFCFYLLLSKAVAPCYRRLLITVPWVCVYATNLLEWCFLLFSFYGNVEHTGP
ncbi:hypothetical protein F5Y15DRAFT_337473 [Xylariaceae sp. FL0016]|nr:hypothetical protein F5Y15DRAFT_337473 [Xylariaceae sp. FL0016]